MAVGQVSSLTGDNWQLIETKVPTAVSSISFTGIAGYKTLMLSWNQTKFGNAVADRLALTFNSDTNAVYAGGAEFPSGAAGSSTRIILTGAEYDNQLQDGNIIITNVLTAAPKLVNGVGMQANQHGVVTGAWNNTSAITSLQFRSAGGTATFSNALGSISLYGIAA
jgi:hypothetical protein